MSLSLLFSSNEMNNTVVRSCTSPLNCPHHLHQACRGRVWHCGHCSIPRCSLLWSKTQLRKKKVNRWCEVCKQNRLMASYEWTRPVQHDNKWSSLCEKKQYEISESSKFTEPTESTDSSELTDSTDSTDSTESTEPGLFGSAFGYALALIYLCSELLKFPKPHSDTKTNQTNDQ